MRKRVSIVKHKVIESKFKINIDKSMKNSKLDELKKAQF